MIGVLKGALFFMSDLLRSLKISVRMDFIHCTSSATKGKGGSPVRMMCDVKEDIKDKHVLLVEDIMDSGVTIEGPGGEGNVGAAAGGLAAGL